MLTSSLLKWCDAIASTYGVSVHNLTTSLADGRALCLLIHYYHPSILPTRTIQNTTASLLTPFQGQEDDYLLDQFVEATALNGGNLCKLDMRKGLEGERKNFAILKRYRGLLIPYLVQFCVIFYLYICVLCVCICL